MITEYDFEQGSPEWHNKRDGRYTGTGAEKLLSYSGQIKVVDGVASNYALTEITGFGGNFYTRRGHVLEDRAIGLYQKITGHSIRRPGFVTNSKYPTCGYSPDGFDETLDIPLEVKCFDENKHMTMFDGDVPVKVLAQIHFGQLIWQKRGARLLIYNPDIADPFYCFKIIDIKYNRNIQNNFKQKLMPKEAYAVHT
jgi:hypothetical protein